MQSKRYCHLLKMKNTNALKLLMMRYGLSSYLLPENNSCYCFFAVFNKSIAYITHINRLIQLR